MMSTGIIEGLIKTPEGALFLEALRFAKIKFGPFPIQNNLLREQLREAAVDSGAGCLYGSREAFGTNLSARQGCTVIECIARSHIPCDTDIFLVTAASSGSIGLPFSSCYVVEKGIDGLHFEAESEMLPGCMESRTFQLNLTNARVPLSQRISGTWPNKKVLAKALGMARLNQASVAVGAAQSGLDHSIKAGAESVRMAQKHASMATQLASARVFIRKTAHYIDTTFYNADAIFQAAMARELANDICIEVLEEVLKMHTSTGPALLTKQHLDLIFFRSDKEPIETIALTRRAVEQRLRVQSEIKGAEKRMDSIPS
ncbi:hypothetical protein CAPTEDRAFT_185274 [Capitella teleta]|uniref:Acyl-CoA dehydrogenase/oxidase C-terminal domain-containing protein n=1 Tax=Capitella teleta TaxID=283909 RepID=R7TAB4_CAPTE|nr:hypothetical protein CAPTEDRAFT_185274 [Capitella teleta]|eukprot:ELT88330.1 hypothetical protein CAPTEDRAFT_185274 [Capitella teleta]